MCFWLLELHFSLEMLPIKTNLERWARANGQRSKREAGTPRFGSYISRFFTKILNSGGFQPHWRSNYLHSGSHSPSKAGLKFSWMTGSKEGFSAVMRESSCPCQLHSHSQQGRDLRPFLQNSLPKQKTAIPCRKSGDWKDRKSVV